MSFQREGQSRSDLGGVLVLSGPGARRPRRRRAAEGSRVVEKLMLEAYVISQKLAAGPGGRARGPALGSLTPGAFRSSPFSAPLERFGP